MKNKLISKLTVLLTVGAVAAALSPLAQAQQTLKPRSVAEPKVPAAQQPPAAQQSAKPASNPVGQAAAQRGVVKCVDRIAQFSGFLTTGSEAGVQLFVAPDAPNSRLVSTSMEIQSKNSLSYAGATFSPDNTPNSSNPCGAVYEAVTYWQNNCDDVAKGAYGSFKAAAPVKQHIRMLDGGPAVRVFLMPAGTGCVSIKKELMH